MGCPGPGTVSEVLMGRTWELWRVMEVFHNLTVVLVKYVYIFQELPILYLKWVHKKVDQNVIKDVPMKVIVL